MKVAQNAKKWLLNCQKMKCSFLDYVQLLMIVRVIQVTKVAQHAENMATKSSKNEMFIFGLHLTSDDWLSDLSNKSHPKCEKMAAKLS